jgi:rSAM/selenodomain-associated transferase 1
VNVAAECLILLFVKYPEEGGVKKRLAADLNVSIAVEAYRNFVLDTLTTLDDLHIPTFICFHPGGYRTRFSKWLGAHRHYMEQRGDDLGERMKNGFGDAFEEGFSRVVLIGSDSPDLPGSVIAQALSSLEAHDAVLGPSVDGGYYLIGFRKEAFLPAAFDGLTWSSPAVFRQTLGILQKAGLVVHTTRKWRDVDTIEDLRELIRRSQDTPFRFSRTASYLSTRKDRLK